MAKVKKFGIDPAPNHVGNLQSKASVEIQQRNALHRIMEDEVKDRPIYDAAEATVECGKSFDGKEHGTNCQVLV